jgi:hypothetical protein
MIKKTALALFSLLFALALITPPKANAEVVVGVGVAPRPAYGYVVARHRPYAYVAPVPYVAYGPGYVYPPVVYPNVVVRLCGRLRQTLWLPLCRTPWLRLAPLTPSHQVS